MAVTSSFRAVDDSGPINSTVVVDCTVVDVVDVAAVVEEASMVVGVGSWLAFSLTNNASVVSVWEEGLLSSDSVSF